MLLFRIFYGDLVISWLIVSRLFSDDRAVFFVRKFGLKRKYYYLRSV